MKYIKQFAIILTVSFLGEALRALLQVFGGKGGGRADSAFGRCDSMDIPRAAEILTELCGGAVPIDTTEA